MEALKDTAAKTLGSKDAKQRDLEHDVWDPSKADRLTTDYGVKQTTADDWLKVVNDDKTGPALLEDPFARERVCFRVGVPR